MLYVKNVCIYLFIFILIFSIGEKRHGVDYDKLRFQPEIICNAVWRMFAYIYLYLTLFSQFVQNDMLLSMINSDFQPEIICNAVWRMFPNIYLFLHQIFLNGVTRHVVEYDKLRFLPEIICNAVCGECLQISIYIYPLFSQMESRDMLLSMINSDFCQKLFVMLYVENGCKYLFIFTPYFLKWSHATCCWVW